MHIKPIDPLIRAAFSELSPFEEWAQSYLATERNCHAFVCNAKGPDASPLIDEAYGVIIPYPGTMGGKPLSKPFHPIPLREAMIANGFIYAPQKNQQEIDVPSDMYLVAAYVSRRYEDLHFHRRHEKTGIWYHKQNWIKPVTFMDSSFHMITNPQTADRGIYDHFSGFFLAPDASTPLAIMIKPMELRYPKTRCRPSTYQFA